MVVPRRWLLGGLLLVVMAAVPVTTVFAASTPNTVPVASGIAISPFLQKVTINQADAQKVFTVTLTNNTHFTQEVALSARDFGSLNETGGILFQGENDYTQKYGLTSWISLESTSVVLEPSASKSVLVTVQNRLSLQPGGHYGAIIASINNRDPTSGNKVSVQQELTSLVFVNKLGGARYDLRLKTITWNGNLFTLPSTVTLRFQNPGNVDVIPRGQVKLKNAGGRVVAQGIINDDSSFVLPESYRQMYVPLQRLAASPVEPPGPYSISVSYRYDGLDRTVTRTEHFIYASAALWLLVIIIAGVVSIKRKSLVIFGRKLAKKLHWPSR
ncbi:MAG: exported protein of unknown function [Candidatus Saccharibacteria bacterium]|nr:exported protein of unknown function [Candidatus Saccharibacteria bacterium]